METGKSAMVLRSTILTCSVIAAAAFSVSADAADQAKPSAQAQATGLWVDHTGKGGIRIEPCGSKLCGKIVWLRDTLNAEGKPMTDRHNPDAIKQKRPLCGVQVLGELTPVAGDGYDGGWIYDPKNGKSYSAAVEVAGPTTLKVTGYLGIRLMGQTFTWTRASGDLPMCDAPPKEAVQTAPAKPVAAVAAAVVAKSANPPKSANVSAGVDEAKIVEGAAAPAATGVPVKPSAVVTSSTAKALEAPAKANAAVAKPLAFTGATPALQARVLQKQASVKPAVKPLPQKVAKPTEAAATKPPSKAAAAAKEVLPWATTTATAVKPVVAKPAAKPAAAKPAQAATTTANKAPGATTKAATTAATKTAPKQVASKAPVLAAIKKPIRQQVEEQSENAASPRVDGPGEAPTQLPPAAATLY